MIKTFTQDDLIRFLYNECEEAESREIKKALICDSELLEIFKELSAVKHQVEQARFEPSDETVQKIMEYARKR